MKRNGRTIRATGVLQKKHDRIRLDRPVPMAAGPVAITMRPARARTRTQEKLNLADLAGIGREMLKGVGVDKWLDQMRNEWDREDR